MRGLAAVVDRASRHRSLLLGLVIAVGLALFHGPALFGHMRFAADPWHFADDVRVLIHPLFRIEDPGLFPGDPAVEYFSRSLPDGYHLLYRLFGPLFGVVFLSKALPYVLLAATLAGLGYAAGKLSGPAAVLGTLSLALGSAYLLFRISGGLPRAFALPLLATGVAFLVAGKVRALAVLVVVAAGFYPVAALLLGATLALLLLLPDAARGSAEGWSFPRRAIVLVVTAALAGAVLLPSLVRLREYGPAITPELWGAFPEAGPGGRFDAVDRAPFPPLPGALLPPLAAALVGAERPLIGLVHVREFGNVAAAVVGLLALAAFVPLARRSVEARRLLVFIAAIVLCHTAALVAGMRLFLPERYVAYGVPVAALVLVPAALGSLLCAERRALRLLPLAYNLVLLALFGARGSSWAGISVSVPPDERALYATLEALPKTALVAGFPGEAIDNVPYLTRRAAFVTRETQMPFHARYTLSQRERTRALLRAYFASTPDALREFRDRYRVTHLLVAPRHFSERPSYFVPFDSDVARAFDALPRGGSAALASAGRTAVFTGKSLVLLDLGRL